LLRRFRPALYREHVSADATSTIDIAERLQAGRKRLIEMRASDAGSKCTHLRGRPVFIALKRFSATCQHLSEHNGSFGRPVFIGRNVPKACFSDPRFRVTSVTS
jgi:hypothetical protein